ncbi:MAG: sensor histidine kinase [Marinilabiliaceae bacterium]|nr:sensor histidine kinase [Marinilabiliaceae bacterium]
MISFITSYVRRISLAKNISFFIYLLFIVLAAMLTYYLGFTNGQANGHQGPMASKGNWIISEADLDENGLLFVQGEFEFYWNQLLTPADFLKAGRPYATHYAEVPSLWNGTTINGERLGSMGYATYRVNIEVPADGWYGLKIGEINCAYQLWANGKRVAAGKVARTKAETIPEWRRKEVYFNSENRRIELVMQVANFHHRKGGPEDVMIFGRGEQVQRYKLYKHGLAMFMMGVLFILIIYFTGSYLFGRRDEAVVFFSLVCLFTVLRVATTGEKIFLDLFPSISWDIAIRIEYFTLTLLTPAVIAFMHSFYKDIFLKKVLIVITSVSLLFGLTYLILPPDLFTYSPAVYQYIILFSGSYILFGLIIAAYKKRTFSAIFLMGYLFFYLVLINDILYFHKLVQSAYLLPYGLFVLFFSFAYVMSKKLAFAYVDVERLTIALDRQNRELEKAVEVRTHEILEQKVAIERQAEYLASANRRLVELNRFRDDMTGMIIHDLKNPLNSIINLARMKDVPDKEELIWQSGKSMLNLVMNIFDVNNSHDTTVIMTKQPVKFCKLLDTALLDVSISAKLRDIIINKACEDDFEVEGDHEILKRVCVNLLTNAIKYSPIKGEISMRLMGHGGRELILWVEDEGPGIREDLRKVLFDSTKRQGQIDKSMRSTGLGLIFCKMAVEAHGGTIGVESPKGKGARFFITLPAIRHGNGHPHKNYGVVSESLSEDIPATPAVARLHPFINQLRLKEVYEVSDIKGIISQIKALKLEGLDNWLKELDEAVISCNNEKYQNTLNKIQNDEV